MIHNQAININIDLAKPKSRALNFWLALIICEYLSLRSNENPQPGQQSTLKKSAISMSSTLEPTIWSCDTDQQMPCFDSSQLTMKWISNIKLQRFKLHAQVDKYGCHAVQRRRRAYLRACEPHAADHDEHEKTNAWVLQGMGLCMEAKIKAPGALLK